MASIRAPWRVRAPRDGRDGFDALPALDGEPGRDGKDGERGLRGLPGPVLREAPAADAVPPLQTARAAVYRDPDTKLWTRVRAPPLVAGGQVINLYPVRGEDDLIEFVDLIPEPT